MRVPRAVLELGDVMGEGRESIFTVWLSEWSHIWYIHGVWQCDVSRCVIALNSRLKVVIATLYRTGSNPWTIGMNKSSKYLQRLPALVLERNSP